MIPRLHPRIGDPVESCRCPECGTPGVDVGRLAGGLLVEMRCPTCDPDSLTLAVGDYAEATS